MSAGKIICSPAITAITRWFLTMKGSPILRNFLELPVFFYGSRVRGVHLTFYVRQPKLSIPGNPSWRNLRYMESLRCQGLCLYSTASLEPKFHLDAGNCP